MIVNALVGHMITFKYHSEVMLIPPIPCFTLSGLIQALGGALV